MKAWTRVGLVAALAVSDRATVSQLVIAITTKAMQMRCKGKLLI